MVAGFSGLLIAIVLLFAPHAGATTPAECYQGGGGVECTPPNRTPYQYAVCDEHGTFTVYLIAWCRAGGGTWANGVCTGYQPRPRSEDDIVPYAQDFTRNLGSVCAGPSAPALPWLIPGQSVFSNLCYSGSPSFTQGWEGFKITDRFAITWTQLDGTGQCNVPNGSNFIAIGGRTVSCSPFSPWTTGTTGAQSCVALSTPRQSFCGSVGNPCNPVTGAKRHVDVDYAGAGNFPLRLERTYNSLIWTLPGRKFWRHSYERMVENDAGGTVPVAMVHRQDGTTYFFREQGGTYITNSDVNHRLEKLLDGSGQTTGWRLHVPDDSVETYDAAGRLLEIARRDGLRQVLSYSDQSTPYTIAPVPGLLVQVRDPYGRTLQFQYDLQQRLTKVIDPAGNEILYSYNTSTQDVLITEVTYPQLLPSGALAKKTYIYADSGWGYPWTLTGIIDENGSRIGTYTYDSAGRVTRTESAGAVNRYDIAAIGGWGSTQRSVTDPRGVVRTYNYQVVDGVYHLASIQSASGLPCPACGPKSASYDGQGNPVQRTDWNDNRTNYTYDPARNLETSRTEGLTSAGAATLATRTIETQWHATLRLPTQITEKNDSGAVLRVTGMSYDATGNLVNRTVTAGANSRTWAYTYNANGQVASIDGPRTDVSDVTTYAYYADDDPDPSKRGNVATITNAVGHVTQIADYNALGQPLSIQDPNGLTTTLAYDARLRLTSRSVGAETTAYNYDGAGQLAKVTLPDGSFLSYSYDAAHRMTAIADNLGNRIAYTLDVMGNRTQEQVLDPANALAQTRSRVFDNLNRLAQDIGAQNQITQYAYDNQGNVASIDGPLPGTVDVTTNAYDALNRLIKVTDPRLGQTQYAYNGIDQLVAVTDPRNLSTSYNYDGLANLNSQVSPDTGTTANTYDAAGNLLTQTDAKSQVTTYAYDALNRVTSITFQDGSKQNYAYDQGANGIGRLSSIAEIDPAQQITSQLAYAYDQKGRVVSETRTIDGVAYLLAYSYDAAGRLSGLTYPSGRAIAYAFDELGRISQVSTTPANGSAQVVASGITYQPFGGVKSYTLGNGQSYFRSYDTDGRIASYSLGSQFFALGYDAASRIGFIAENGSASNVNTYGYDTLDRLTDFVGPSAGQAFTYDGVGNRLTKSTGFNTYTYSYAATSNRLTAVVPSSGPLKNYVHDANGSVSADGANTYAYDARGRLVQASTVIGTVTYQLNALGQRFRKASALGDTIYHYDSQGRLIAESSPSGQARKEYIYLGNIPVAVWQ